MIRYQDLLLKPILLRVAIIQSLCRDSKCLLTCARINGFRGPTVSVAPVPNTVAVAVKSNLDRRKWGVSIIDSAIWLTSIFFFCFFFDIEKFSEKVQQELDQGGEWVVPVVVSIGRPNKDKCKYNIPTRKDPSPNRYPVIPRLGGGSCHVSGHHRQLMRFFFPF